MEGLRHRKVRRGLTPRATPTRSRAPDVALSEGHGLESRTRKAPSGRFHSGIEPGSPPAHAAARENSAGGEPGSATPLPPTPVAVPRDARSRHDRRPASEHVPQRRRGRARHNREALEPRLALTPHLPQPHERERLPTTLATLSGATASGISGRRRSSADAQPSGDLLRVPPRALPDCSCPSRARSAPFRTRLWCRVEPE